MAIYRTVHIEYWRDEFVIDLTPEEKYFYIYLMTNSKTSQSGIYELPKRIIEIETGYNRETIDKLLSRFESYGKIVYCQQTKEIFIKNWIKYNKIASSKVRKCVEKELSFVKSEAIINMYLNECEKYGYDIDICKKKTNTFIDNQSEDLDYKEKSNPVGKFKTLYEQNVGLINPIVAEWLIEVADTIDYELFKKAIDISTDRGRCNKGYIKGILKQWGENNIKNMSDLRAYEKTMKNRGDKDGKSKYALSMENEDEGLYRKPTEEELEEIRREYDSLRKPKQLPVQ